MNQEQRFDDLTRGLATNQLSRTRMLKGLAAGMFLGLTGTFGLGCSKRRKDTASPPEAAPVKPLPPAAARVPPSFGRCPAVEKKETCDEIWKEWTKSKAPPPKGAPVTRNFPVVAVETCEEFEKDLRSKGVDGVLAGFTKGKVSCPDVAKDVDITFVRIGPESVPPTDPKLIKERKEAAKQKQPKKTKPKIICLGVTRLRPKKEKGDTFFPIMPSTTVTVYDWKPTKEPRAPGGHCDKMYESFKKASIEHEDRHVADRRQLEADLRETFPDNKGVWEKTKPAPDYRACGGDRAAAEARIKFLVQCDLNEKCDQLKKALACKREEFHKEVEENAKRGIHEAGLNCQECGPHFCRVPQGEDAQGQVLQADQCGGDPAPAPTKGDPAPTQQVYCNCNEKCYDDVQVCLNECKTSLGCFTGICGPAEPGQCVASDEGQPVPQRGDEAPVAPAPTDPGPTSVPPAEPGPQYEPPAGGGQT